MALSRFPIKEWGPAASDLSSKIFEQTSESIGKFCKFQNRQKELCVSDKLRVTTWFRANVKEAESVWLPY